MKIEQKDSYWHILMDESNFESFFLEFEKLSVEFKKEHLVLDFSNNSSLTLENLLLFLHLANDKRKNNFSFIIIAKGIDIDAIPDEINIVPTFVEAIDTLELYAIERDLMGY